MTEIKNITGNAISDSEIIGDVNIKEEDFNDKMTNLYLAKRKSRIEK